MARLADVRCPVCERRWHRAEVSPVGLLVEAKCESARCHGAIRTVCWQDGRAILMTTNMRPEAVSPEPLKLDAVAASTGGFHGYPPRP